MTPDDEVKAEGPTLRDQLAMAALTGCWRKANPVGKPRPARPTGWPTP